MTLTADQLALDFVIQYLINVCIESRHFMQYKFLILSIRFAETLLRDYDIQL